MTMASVKTGRIRAPYKTVLYGPDGVGKSTFAAGAPAPIFLGTENGTNHLDISRFPQPRTWSEVFEAIKSLGVEQHEYKTMVVDTLDWLEPLCYQSVCEDCDVKSIEEPGYGRGYQYALEKWRTFLSRLELLIARKSFNIVLLAHSQIRKFQNPEGEDFDRYELKLHAKSSHLIREWADDVLFANYETFATRDTNKRVRGVDTGARLIYTSRRAAYDAKNRSGLPESLPLSWDDYDAAAKSGAAASTEDLMGAIAGLLSQVDEPTRAKASAATAAAKDDARKLSQIFNRLQAITNQQHKEAS